MSSIRVSGNTSGYYDLTVPDVAGQNTIPLDRVVATDTNGHIQISGGSTNNDDSAAVITAASTEHAKIRIDTSSTSNHRATLALESGSYEVNIATSGLDEMRFSTQNTSDALFIGSNGRIGIGTTVPVEGLEVFGTNGADNMALKYSGTAGGHQSGYLWKDFRGQPNAGIYNNLQDDGVGSAAAQMEFYTSHAGTMTKQMAISRYGAVTMPNQPSASVKLNSDNSQGGQAVTIGPGGTLATSLATIKFETTVSNTGGHYSTSTGRFTCPVDGKYFVTFNSNVNMSDATGNTFPEIHLNNALYIRAYDSNDYNQGAWVQQSITAIIPCSAGDYLEIKLRCNSGYAWADSDTQYTQASFMLL